MKHPAEARSMEAGTQQDGALGREMPGGAGRSLTKCREKHRICLNSGVNLSHP